MTDNDSQSNELTDKNKKLEKQNQLMGAVIIKGCHWTLKELAFKAIEMAREKKCNGHPQIDGFVYLYTAEEIYNDLIGMS